MEKEPNLFPLKLLVISLGFVLAGGMVFVLTTLAHKANEMNNAPCKDVHVSLRDINIQGTITAITPQGNAVLVTLTNAPDTYILTLDNCTGKLLQQFTITP